MAKTVKCDVCGAMFDPRGIKSHRDRYHPETGTPNPGAPGPKHTEKANEDLPPPPQSPPSDPGALPPTSEKKKSGWWFG